ncbi:MAG: HIT domain-containing protein [Chloroflexi bacterium]|nr:HIT domain-containing protein [Chloroflexota bacterium]
MSKSKEEIIWAPWRIGFILGEKECGCFICRKLGEDRDKGNYILERTDLSVVIMNLYPYNNGHIMIAPVRHSANFEDLTADESLDMMSLLKRWIKILKKAYKPDGFNAGLNLGKAAGAGLEDHIHLHLVPRWNGDTNFMPAIGAIKIMPESLDSCYDKLKSLTEEEE